jgi:hypothetical protein
MIPVYGTEETVLCDQLTSSEEARLLTLTTAPPLALPIAALTL